MAPPKADPRLAELGISPRDIDSGVFFLSKKGKIAYGSFSESNVAKIEVGNRESSGDVLKKLAADAQAQNKSVVITGDVPLDELVKTAKDAKLGLLENRVFVTLDPESPMAQAKKRLLERKFHRVEIVIDLPSGTVGPLFDKHVVVLNSSASPRRKGAVRVMTPAQLGGHGSFADRMKAVRPAPGVLRISVAHQSGGVAYLSDGPQLPLSELYKTRLNDGGSECFLGCNMAYDPGSWFVYDGKLLSEDVAALANDLSDKLAKKGGATGQELLDIVAGRIFTTSKRAKPKNERIGFRLLEVVALGLVAESGATTAKADDDKDKQDVHSASDQGGFEAALLEPKAGRYRVMGESPWFVRSGLITRLNAATEAAIRERSLVFYDAPTGLLIFLPSTSTQDEVIPRPIAISTADGMLSDKERNDLKSRSGDFWLFYSSKPDDANRKMLRDWQRRAGIDLPFVFIPFSTQPTANDWELLKPFLRDVTHAGLMLPETADQAHALGLFWCNAHHTGERLSKYNELTEIVGQLSADKPPVTIPLSGDLSTSLRPLFSTKGSNLWLVGVWSDSKLRRVEGDVPNTSWLPEQMCIGRATFVSAYPMARPLPGYFFENKAPETILRVLPPLVHYAVDNVGFDVASAQFTEAVNALHELGGVFGVSVCEKYAVISE